MTAADREDLSAPLVFLANGTLEGAEKARVEAAVAADPALQEELAALRAIRAQMQAEAVLSSPGAFGQARLMRVSGRVAVTFSFDARGRVTAVSLAASSGHASLDQEAIAMVRRASPFPPIPPQTGRAVASFTAPIRYDLPF